MSRAMRHIKKINAFASMCKELNTLSTCKRMPVSCIIFPTDCSQIYSIGYNGPPSGIDNCSCTEQEGNCGCVHAEINALIKFNPHGSKPSILYCDSMLCVNCAAAIINCKEIAVVLWNKPYRNTLGCELIEKSNTIIFQLSELNNNLGLIRDWI